MLYFLSHLKFYIVHAVYRFLFRANITHTGSTPIFPSAFVSVSLYAGRQSAWSKSSSNSLGASLPGNFLSVILPYLNQKACRRLPSSVELRIPRIHPIKNISTYTCYLARFLVDHRFSPQYIEPSGNHTGLRVSLNYYHSHRTASAPRRPAFGTACPPRGAPCDCIPADRSSSFGGSESRIESRATSPSHNRWL